MDGRIVGYACPTANNGSASGCVSAKQLMGRYRRLQKELAVAYSMVPWQMGRINRLVNDLAVTEREIAAPQPVYERRSEPVTARRHVAASKQNPARTILFADPT